MEPAVNFDNLRLITGGDVALESELLMAFITSATECFTELRIAQEQNNETAWKSHAHAFKGLCFNLGAGPLGQLCKKAQDDYLAPGSEKQEMLKVIEEEFIRVQSVLREMV